MLDIDQFPKKEDVYMPKKRGRKRKGQLDMKLSEESELA